MGGIKLAPTFAETQEFDRQRAAIYEEQKHMSKTGKRIAPRATNKKVSILKTRGNPPLILEVGESPGQDKDYGIEAAGVSQNTLPPAFDTSKQVFSRWLKPYHQGDTGSCVGQAGSKVLQHHLYRAKVPRISHPRNAPSRKFLWMGSKETDTYTLHPTSMVNTAGTYLKSLLSLAIKYGAPTEREIPMDSGGSMLSEAALYEMAAKYKIKSYHATSTYNRGAYSEGYRRWLVEHGPMIVRVKVDTAFARARKKVLTKFDSSKTYGYHAIVCFAYRTNTDGDREYGFLNSWGPGWGDGGVCWMSEGYVRRAITESYGVKL